MGQYKIQHRTVLIISPVTSPDKHSSDAVYWRGGGLVLRKDAHKYTYLLENLTEKFNCEKPKAPEDKTAVNSIRH